MGNQDKAEKLPRKEKFMVRWKGGEPILVPAPSRDKVVVPEWCGPCPDAYYKHVGPELGLTIKHNF